MFPLNTAIVVAKGLDRSLVLNAELASRYWSVWKFTEAAHMLLRADEGLTTRHKIASPVEHADTPRNICFRIMFQLAVSQHYDVIKFDQSPEG